MLTEIASIPARTSSSAYSGCTDGAWPQIDVCRPSSRARAISSPQVLGDRCVVRLVEELGAQVSELRNHAEHQVLGQVVVGSGSTPRRSPSRRNPPGCGLRDGGHLGHDPPVQSSLPDPAVRRRPVPPRQGSQLPPCADERDHEVEVRGLLADPGARVPRARAWKISGSVTYQHRPAIPDHGVRLDRFETCRRPPALGTRWSGSRSSGT